MLLIDKIHPISTIHLGVIMYPSWFTGLLTGGIDLVHQVVLQRMRRRWWRCTGQGSRELFVFSRCETRRASEQKLWTFVRHSCKLSVCFFVVFKKERYRIKWPDCWSSFMVAPFVVGSLFSSRVRMKPFVPACGIVKHWLGRVRAMTRAGNDHKTPAGTFEFQWFCTVFLKPKVGYVGVWPLPSKSDHQDYSIFSRGIPINLYLPLASWEGATPKGYVSFVPWFG